jgi:hypothetical protein
MSEPLGFRLGLSAALLVAMSACGSEESVEDVTDPSGKDAALDNNSTDAGQDGVLFDAASKDTTSEPGPDGAFPDAMSETADGPACALPGQQVCSGQCVSTATDPSHCGQCDHPCATGGTCSSGICSCPSGTAECAGDCVRGCVVVAASDSSAQSKASATYVCDGADDQEQINAAFGDARLAGGGKVLLMEGTFAANGVNILPTAGSILQGQGEGTTFIKFTGTHRTGGCGHVGALRVQEPNVTVRDFTITNHGLVLITDGGDFASIRRVTVTDIDLSGPDRVQAVFMVCATDKGIEGVEFNDCKALDVPSFGFLVHDDSYDGTHARQTIKDIRFVDCHARNCGNVGDSGRFSDWDVGFDFQENNHLDGCEVTRCLSEGSWESGFHLDARSGTTTSRVQFRDCVSKNNAQKRRVATPLFGAGYFAGNGTQFRDCQSAGNFVGFHIAQFNVEAPVDVSFQACSDDGSETGFLIHPTEGVTLTDCESKNARGQAIVVKGARKITISNLKITDPACGPLLTYEGINVGACAYFGNERVAYWQTQEVDMTGLVATGGQADSFLYFDGAAHVHVTGSLTTGSAFPITVSGSPTNDLTVESAVITYTGSATESAGLLVTPEVTSADTIKVHDSTVADPSPSNLKYGIWNRSVSQVKIRNVSVDGAATDFVNCQTY